MIQVTKYVVVIPPPNTPHDGKTIEIAIWNAINKIWTPSMAVSQIFSYYRVFAKPIQRNN